MTATRTSSKQSGDGDIRKAIVDGDLVACMVALPGQLFRSTQIPACLWFLARDKSAQGAIQRITQTYHAWRGTDRTIEYADVPGFCKRRRSPASRIQRLGGRWVVDGP